MSDLSEIKALVEAQGKAWTDYQEANDQRLKSLEEKGYAPADIVEKVATIDADISKLSKDIADQMLAIQRPAVVTDGKKQLTADEIEHKQAFARFLRKGDDNGLEAIQRKAMNSLSDPEGGYLIPVEMDAMIDRIVPTVSALGGLVNVRNIGTQSYTKRVKTSGMSMRRPGPGAGGGETTEPNYAKIEIVAYDAEVEPWVQNSTLEDADIDLGMDLADEAAIAFAEGLGSELVSGNGVEACRGITSYTNVANSSYAWGKVGYIASGASGAFTTSAPADKIVQLQHALKQQYRPGAVFVMSDATLSTVRQMKDGSGAYYLWQPDPTGSFSGRLLGFPVVIDDNMAAVAANSYSIAFGNFKRAYTLVNRRGTVLIRDNVTTKGVTKFNFTRRFGGGIVNFEAIKLMKFAAS